MLYSRFPNLSVLELSVASQPEHKIRFGEHSRIDKKSVAILGLVNLGISREPLGHIFPFHLQWIVSAVLFGFPC
jgi:hypothetical protein